MENNFKIIYDDCIDGNHLTMIKILADDALYLYDKYKPDHICDDPVNCCFKIFIYNRKIEFENVNQCDYQYRRTVRFSEMINNDNFALSESIVLLDIKNGTDIVLDNTSYKVNLNIFSKSIIVALDGYNEYSSITCLDNVINNTIFYNMPSTMRIYLNSPLNKESTFIGSKCTYIVDKRFKKYLEKVNADEMYYINDPLDSIRNFNEKRGLIEQGFDLRRELNFIVEEVVEATNINLGSDKAKEKAKVIVDELLKECVTTNENSMDAFIDIIVFAVGALYKLAPRMNIDVKEEIMKVIRNIEFKPYIKDENGKVIKDPNYKKYREK